MNKRGKTAKTKPAVIIIVILAVAAVGAVLVSGIIKKSNVPTVDLPQEVTEAKTADSVASADNQTLTGRCGEKAYYVFDENTNTLTITGSGTVWDAGDAELNYWDGIKSRVKVVKIASGITGIGAYSLESLNKVEAFEISDTVEVIGTSMGASALSWSDDLLKITVDQNNPNYSSDNLGVLYNKTKTEILRYPTGSTEIKFEVPASVKKIGVAAFSDCENLLHVTVPETVEEIDNEAFLGCSEDLTISCVENSAAHQFAKENMLKFDFI